MVGTDILEHFKVNDTKIHSLIIKKGIEIPAQTPTHELYIQLTRTIVYQQLHGKAAQTIFNRFISLYPTQSPNPQEIIDTPIEKLREVGLSNSKANYIQNIAKACVEGSLDFSKLYTMTDDDVISALTTIKGVGKWTAQMFLIFNLSRPNVFSYGDLGLMKAITKLYGYKKTPSIATISRIVKRWDPYKTYATLSLWKYIDDKE